MRLTGFQINRFGILDAQRVDGLSPGISVFLGDNEAGKSTLLRFFQAVLFGFKRGNTFLDGMHTRKEGVGGLLFLDTQSLGGVTLHADSTQDSGPVLRDAAGTQLPPAAVARLLAGMTQEMFDAVFAFDLARLVAFSSKKDDPVRNALHGAAFGTGFTSPAGVLKELEERKKSLLKASTGISPLNSRRRELEEALTALAGMEPPTQQWEAVQAELAATAEALGRNSLEYERLQSDLRLNHKLAVALEHRADLRLLEASVAALLAEGPLPPRLASDAVLRPVALEADIRNKKATLQGLLTELHGFQERRQGLAPRPELAALAPQTASLREQKEMFRTRSLELQDLQRNALSLQERRQELLSRLGPTWDEAAALACDTSPAGLDALNHAEKSLRDAENVHAERLGNLDRLAPPVETPAQTQPAGPALPTEEQADALTAQLALALHALENLPGREAARRAAALEYNRALEALRPLPPEAVAALERLDRAALTATLAAGEVTTRTAHNAAQSAAQDAARAEAALEEARQEHADALAARHRLGPDNMGATLLERTAAARRLEAECREQFSARQPAAPRLSGLLPMGLALLLAGAALAGFSLAGDHPSLLPAGAVAAGIGLVAAVFALISARRHPAGTGAPNHADFLRRVAALGDIPGLNGGNIIDAAALQTALEYLLRLQQDLRGADEDVLRAERRLLRAQSLAEEAQNRRGQADAAALQAVVEAQVYLSALGFPADTPLAAADGLPERLEIFRARRQTLEDIDNALRSGLRTFAVCRVTALEIPFFAPCVPVGDVMAEIPAHAPPLLGSDALEAHKVLYRSLEQACRRLAALRRQVAAQEAEQAASHRRATEINHARKLLEQAEQTLLERRRAWDDLAVARGFAPGISPEALRAALELQKEFAVLTRQAAENTARQEALGASLAGFIEDLNKALDRGGLRVPAESSGVAERLHLLDELAALVDKALHDTQEAERLDARTAAAKAGIQEVRTALELAEADLAAILHSAGVDDVPGFHLAVERRRRYEEFAKDRLRLEAALADAGVGSEAGFSAGSGGDFGGENPGGGNFEAESRLEADAASATAGSTAFAATAAALDADELLRLGGVMREDLRRLEEERAALVGRRGALHERAEALGRGDGTAPLRRKIEALREELRELSRRWCVPALARHFLEEAKAEFERRGREGIIGTAGKIFAAVTAGEYLGIAPRLDGDDFNFAALYKDGSERDPEKALSRGTREQLYLALRLAFIRHHAEHSEALPAVMDDILVNFDPTRAANTARELAAFSQDNQILFFTCRPEQAQLLMEAGRAAHAAGAIQAGQNGQAGQSGQAGQTGEVAPAASGVYGQAGGVPAPVLYTVRQGDIRPALDV